MHSNLIFTITETYQSAALEDIEYDEPTDIGINMEREVVPGDGLLAYMKENGFVETLREPQGTLAVCIASEMSEPDGSERLKKYIECHQVSRKSGHPLTRSEQDALWTEILVAAKAER